MTDARVPELAEPPPAVVQPVEAASGPVALAPAPTSRRTIIQKGTGLPVRPRAVSITPTTDGDVTLNFNGADLQEVVRAILGDTLKYSYTIDPRVQGTVSLQTSAPLPRETVLATLEDILRANNAALVRSGDVYRVVPANEAARGTAPLSVGRTAPGRNGFGVQVVPLRYIAAADMQKILEPMAPEGGVRVIDPTRNVIVLAGTGQEIASLLEMVQTFDVDWLEGMSIALFQLQFAEAKSLAEELDSIFRGLRGGEGSGAVHFIPIERLNTVLVISAAPEYLDRARVWVERLDRGSENGAPQLFVYQVRNGRAADLSEVLSNVFGAETPQAPRRAEIETITPGLAAVEIQRGADGVQTVQTLDRFGVVPDPAQPIVPPPAPREQGLTVPGQGQVRIIPDEKRNALVILATPRQFQMIEAALARLDVPPLQVLIEATIAEVALNDVLDYGVQWFLRHGNHSVTLSEAATGAVTPNFPGFAYTYLAGDSAAVLSLLSSVTDVRVVSSPQLMVMDNQSARLQVGDQVPIATQSAVSFGSATPTVINAIVYRDTGVILEVTPTVGPGGTVLLDIKQEVSEVARTTTSAIESPTIQQRRVSSRVAVQSEQTIALGGLIRDSKSDIRSGIPGLMDIPVFGALFRSTDQDFRRSELIVLLTPRIVRNPAEARQVTDSLRKRMRGLGTLPNVVH